MTIAEELADLLRPAVAAMARSRAQIVIGTAVVITLLCGSAAAGAAVDDAAIDRHRAVAAAEVLDGSTFVRTLVRFTTTSGAIVVPELGVAYPRGLRAGDSVTVEYDATDPDHVRVADRSAPTRAWPLLAVVVVAWLVLWPLSRRMRPQGPRR